MPLQANLHTKAILPYNMRGLGNDIIEISRIASAIRRYDSRFLNRVFTEKEQQYCSQHSQPERHYAGRFAAKEAIVKALGTGLKKGVSWLDIEIVNNEEGKPCVTLSPFLEKRFPGAKVHLSISHCKEYATAVAILL